MIGQRGHLLGAAMLASLIAPLPVPPIPPEHPPLGALAPVPSWEQPFRFPGEEQDRSRVDLRFYRVDRPDPSQGFAPGSHFQQNDERRQNLIPGFLVRVPLSPP